MIGSELTGGRARPSLAPGRGGREEEDVTEVVSSDELPAESAASMQVFLG